MRGALGQCGFGGNFRFTHEQQRETTMPGVTLIVTLGQCLRMGASGGAGASAAC